MAWQTILEKNGILNQFLRLLSLPDVSLINTPAAIVIGMIYNFLPYMILPLYVALSKINGNVIAAARDLGANSWQTFTKVILPLSLPGAISGITMVFIPSLTTFFISGLLGAIRSCSSATSSNRNSPWPMTGIWAAACLWCSWSSSSSTWS